VGYENQQIEIEEWGRRKMGKFNLHSQPFPSKRLTMIKLNRMCFLGADMCRYVWYTLT